MSVCATVLPETVSELSPSASSSLPSSPPSSSSAAIDLPPPGVDPEDDEGMKHLQQVLENSQSQDMYVFKQCQPSGYHCFYPVKHVQYLYIFKCIDIHTTDMKI